MLPPMPARFSITICWPHISERRAAMMRAPASTVPPGGNGTTRRTKRDGQVCARAAGTNAGAARAAAQARKRRRASMAFPCLRWRLSSSPHGAKRNAVRAPDFAALHPGYAWPVVGAARAWQRRGPARLSIMAFRNRVTALLGIEHPVLLAPMDTVADGKLAAAVSKAGGLGLLGGGYGDAAWLERE